MTTIEVLKSGQIMETRQIDRSIFRIGSDSQAALSLVGCEPHTLTIIQRSGQTRLINRSAHAITIAGTMVAPAATALWSNEQFVDIGRDLRLRLIAGGSGARRSRRNKSRNRSRHNSDVQMREPSKLDCSKAKAAVDRKNRILAASVILAGAAVLFATSITPRRLNVTRDFCELMSALSSLNDPLLTDTQSTLRKARAYEVRGMKTEAAREYSTARELLRVSANRAGNDAASGNARIIQQALMFAERF